VRRIPVGFLSLVLVVAACAVAARGPAPGTPGYVAPWNRATLDSVVDLDPGAKEERFEMSGKLVSPDGVTPMAGLRVYAYHADARGLYADPKWPELHHKAGVFRSGPGGGFILRSTLPGMYEGPPHVHMEADIPGKGRSTWWVSFYPDSASWPLPNTIDLGSRQATSLEFKAVLHRDPDGVYRTRKTLHVGNWYANGSLDSIRAVIARKYERAPWRAGPAAKVQVRH
jgi:hypothetical protein